MCIRDSPPPFSEARRLPSGSESPIPTHWHSSPITPKLSHTLSDFFRAFPTRDLPQTLSQLKQ
eukprot:592698-Rhodomonas_salina.3